MTYIFHVFLYLPCGKAVFEIIADKFLLSWSLHYRGGRQKTYNKYNKQAWKMLNGLEKNEQAQGYSEY